MNARLVKRLGGGLAEFSTVFGSGVGLWDPHDIEEGEWRYTEVDIDDEAQLGVNVTFSAEARFSISYKDGVNTIHALIEQVDWDGAICLRLNIDCIILMAASPGEFYAHQFITITVPADRLKLM